MIHEAELRRVALFQGLDDRTIDMLSSAFSLTDLRASEVLFEAGAPATDAWVVLSGDILLEVGDDEPEPLATMRRGDLVGAVSLVDGGDHLSRARAGETGARLARLPLAEFARILDRPNELSWRLMETVTRRLVHRLREATSMLKDVPAGP